MKARGNDGVIYAFYIFLICDKHIFLPRKTRINVAGGLHYIIYRGIKRRQIFLNDTDRDNFLEHLGCKGKGRQILIID